MSSKRLALLATTAQSPMPSNPIGAVTVDIRSRSQSSPIVEITESSSHFCSRKRLRSTRPFHEYPPCYARPAVGKRLSVRAPNRLSEDLLQSRYRHRRQTARPLPAGPPYVSTGSDIPTSRTSRLRASLARHACHRIVNDASAAELRQRSRRAKHGSSSSTLVSSIAGEQDILDFSGGARSAAAVIAGTDNHAARRLSSARDMRPVRKSSR